MTIFPALLIFSGSLATSAGSTLGVEEDEEAGVDLVDHAEAGYDLGTTTCGGFRSAGVSTKENAEVTA